MRRVETVVEPVSSGVRLDVYLSERFTYQSRTGWQEFVRSGRISVNGRPARPSRRLNAGDLIRFDTAGIAEPDVDASYRILLDSDSFLAADKPAPLPTHPGGCYFRNTLLSLLEERFGTLFPVNRLDRETSGISIFAKTPEAAAALSRLFISRSVEKRYVAMVRGVFSEPVLCRGFLSSDPNSPVRKKRRFTPKNPGDGEFCETAFEPIRDDGAFSLVLCRPKTGRLHQIRATLQSIGFPLVGDKLYGPDDTLFLRFLDDALTEEDRAALILPRQALHASLLAFFSPFDGTEIRLESPSPFSLPGHAEQEKRPLS